MKTRLQIKPSSGFTLIEVVISAALMALILTSAYLCLRAGIAGQKLVEPRADILQNARVAAALLTADLRSACPLSTNYQFLGTRRKLGEVDADNLDFATHNYTPRHAREGDFCEVSYFMDKDEETGQFGLWRRRNPTMALDPLSGGSREEIARGLLGVRFEYYDGTDWYDDWGDEKGGEKAATSNQDHPNLEGMPQAVRITLLFDSNPKSKPVPDAASHTPEPPLVFQTVACLNLANTAQRDATGASSATTQPGNGVQSPSGGGSAF
ncbi:MAG TPA: prepilin-type N-terminal cleavage/methylation domain-containing protein [Verrucomicrobiae bacterium]|jgi:prepilin-type N-terminal cleavage/methylation domain-containing protein|nr:prepilin-type N-terminal cleavage/methylation domain-containing protein [Verrucomicrobiae bacterium]